MDEDVSAMEVREEDGMVRDGGGERSENGRKTCCENGTQGVCKEGVLWDGTQEVWTQSVLLESENGAYQRQR